MEKEVIYKVVLIGAEGVGKTCILTRMQGKQPSLETHATVGVEFCSIYVTIQGSPIKMQMWDAGGQERFRALTAVYHKHSHGIIIVFDVTRRSTLEDGLKRFEDSRITAGKVPTILLGNKIQLTQRRQVSYEQAQDAALQRGIEYKEVSALNGTGIAGIVQRLAERIHSLKQSEGQRQL